MVSQGRIGLEVKELMVGQLLGQLQFMNDLIPGIQAGDRTSKRALNIIEESHERLFRLFAETHKQEH